MTRLSVRTLAAAAPIIFVAHVVEEAPGFVHWFNAHVERGITPELFWTVNISGLAITLAVCVVAWASPSGPSHILLFSWLSFLFGANALLHVMGALADRAYVPGLITALALYIPFYVVLFRQMLRARHVPLPALAFIALVAGAPMLAHGYLIIFRGSRLF